MISAASVGVCWFLALASVIGSSVAPTTKMGRRQNGEMPFLYHEVLFLFSLSMDSSGSWNRALFPLKTGRRRGRSDGGVVDSCCRSIDVRP